MSEDGIPCLWMRGGSSKGAYFLASDLPDEKAARPGDARAARAFALGVALGALATVAALGRRR